MDRNLEFSFYKATLLSGFWIVKTGRSPKDFAARYMSRLEVDRMKRPLVTGVRAAYLKYISAAQVGMSMMKAISERIEKDGQGTR